MAPSDADQEKKKRKEFYSVLYSQLSGENTACHPWPLKGSTRSVSQQSKGELWASIFIVVLLEGKRANRCRTG